MVLSLRESTSIEQQQQSYDSSRLDATLAAIKDTSRLDNLIARISALNHRLGLVDEPLAMKTPHSNSTQWPPSQVTLQSNPSPTDELEDFTSTDPIMMLMCTADVE